MFLGGLSGVWRAAPGLCPRYDGRGFVWESCGVHGPCEGLAEEEPVPPRITHHLLLPPTFCPLPPHPHPVTLVEALASAGCDIKAVRSLPDQAGQSRTLQSQAARPNVQAQSLQGLAASVFKEWKEWPSQATQRTKTLLSKSLEKMQMQRLTILCSQ